MAGNFLVCYCVWRRSAYLDFCVASFPLHCSRSPPLAPRLVHVPTRTTEHDFNLFPVHFTFQTFCKLFRCSSPILICLPLHFSFLNISSRQAVNALGEMVSPWLTHFLIVNLYVPAWSLMAVFPSYYNIIHLLIFYTRLPLLPVFEKPRLLVVFYQTKAFS